MDDSASLDKENRPVAGNRVKREKMANASSCAKLADISNLQQQPKLQAQMRKRRNPFASGPLKPFTSLRRIEVQKATMDMQKVQQQNSKLARENSQMLGLKVLQHEMGCANCLLKKRKFMELEQQRMTKLANLLNQMRRINSLKHTRGGNQKVAPWTLVIAKPAHAKEKADKKRVSRRRQSGRFQSQEPEETIDSLEMDDTKFLVASLTDEVMQGSSPTPSSSSVQKEHVERNSAPRDEPQESRRSVGWPLPLISCVIQ